MEAPTSLDRGGDLVTLLDRLPEPAVILHDRSTIGYANPAAAQLLGTGDPGSLTGRRLSAFLAADDAERVLGRLDQQAGQAPIPAEAMVTQDGEAIHVELSALPVELEGRPGRLVFLDDVTRHTQNQASLRDALSLHEATLEATSEGVLVVDITGDRIASYNQRFLEIWGLPEAAVEDRDPDTALEQALDKAQDPEAFQAQVERIYDEPALEISETIELVDGRVLEWRSRPRYLGDEIVGRVSTFRDITDHRRAHEELERALALTRASFEATADGLLVIDRDGKVVEANDRFYNMWGIPDHLRAKGDDEALLAFVTDKLEDPEGFRERVEALYDDPEAESFDVLTFKDGRVFERFSRPQKVAGETVGRVWSFRDVTDRVRMERELREAVSLHRSTIEATADGVVVVDLEGGLRTFNDQFCTMWGFDPEELERMSVDQALERILDLVREPEILEAHVDHLFDNPEIEDTLTVRLTDGRVFERYSKPQRISDEIVGRVVTFRDVTGWRRAEMDLQRRIERANLRAQASEALTRTLPDYRDGLEQVATAISETLGGGCAIRLLGDDQEILEPVAFHHPDPELRGKLASLVEGTTHRSGRTLTGQVQASGEGILISDLTPDELQDDLPPGYEAYFEAASVESLIMVPIRAQGQSIGVIAVDRSDRGPPLNPDDLRLLQDMADRVGLVVLNARLFEEIQAELDRRQTAEAALRESERAFRSLYENAPVGIYRTTPEGDVLLANPALVDMLGIPGQALQDRNLAERFEPAYDREAWKQRLEAEGEIRGLESTWTLNDGTEIHVRESARVVRDEEGQVAYYEGTVEDISARVQIEEALREQRDLYASLLRAQSDLNEGMLICDASTGKVIYANDAYTRITGYSDEELAELDTFLEVVVPEERDHLLDRFGPEAPEGDLHDHLTTRIEHKDGSERSVECSITQMESRGAELMIALVRDITDREEAKAALEETAERLAEAQRVAKLGSWRLDLEAEQALWSDQMHQLFGFEPSPAPLPLEAIMERIHPEDRERVSRTIETAVETGEPYSLDNRILLPDGEIRWIHAQGEPEYDEDGKPVGLMGTAQDITERKQAEEEVRRLNEELEARVEERTRQLRLANQELEAFSYSVSHDLQAPLQTINGFTKIVLDEHGRSLDEEASFLLERVREASRRMDNLIRSLLTLSRVTRRSIDRRPVDLTDLATRVADRLQERDPDRQVTIDIQDGLEAMGDPKLLEVLLENLLSNAWKFTQGTEDARIEVGARQQGDQTEFYVRDNGVGFDMAYADKLFQPFQRLHEEGSFEGTGIGLATVQRIVARHGGSVRAGAEVNEGATFSFTL